eukprot:GILK01011626.1.p1 GENE.GILK01011626.1~~GILK01011626.1.p1  ORF type:complete len:304 (+),score=31.42 GILK01011626.1:32-943(+)
MSAKWKLLRKALLPSARKEPEDSETEAASIHRHAGFRLIDTSIAAKRELVDGVVETDIAYHISPELSIIITNKTIAKTAEMLKKASESRVDNTGNICIWPTEEVLAFYCKQRPHLFAGKRVCEFGAGMAGLAGICIAAVSDASQVVVTDGNSQATLTLTHNVRQNAHLYGDTRVSAECFVWDRSFEMDGYMSTHPDTSMRELFDVIVAADCCFFKDFHIDLVHVLDRLLSPNGTAYIMAPKRGDSLDVFIEHCRNSLDVQILQHYEDQVSQKHSIFIRDEPHLYDPNIHYPLLLLLTHKQTKL